VQNVFCGADSKNELVRKEMQRDHDSGFFVAPERQNCPIQDDPETRLDSNTG
jgi:hypothetical protein